MFPEHLDSGKLLYKALSRFLSLSPRRAGRPPLLMFPSSSSFVTAVFLCDAPLSRARLCTAGTMGRTVSVTVFL